MADRQEFRGQVDFKGAFHVNERYLEPVFTESTTHTSAGQLVKNTLNFIQSTGAHTFDLPPVATSRKGDIVIVKYIADTGATNNHIYDTDGDSFAATSNIVVAKELADGQGFAVVTPPNGTSEDQLTLTAAANGGAGVGTQLYFVYTGSQWCVHHGEVYHRAQGNGSAAITVAFS